MAFQISLTSTSSEIVREYPEGILLKEAYEVGLKHFVFWNTVYNITNDNNVLVLVDPVKKDRHEVHIEPGYYELDDIVAAFSEQQIIKNSFTYIGLTKRSLKIRIKSQFQVEFSSPNNIGSVLGFSSDRVIKPNKQEYSDKPANIFSINTVKVHCNLIRSNIEDLKRNTNVLYDFPLDHNKIGGKVIKEINPICYFTINTSEIYELVIRITDQSNKLINFLGEEINLTLDFHPYGRQ